MRVHRSKINPAKYNPRVIDPSSRRLLKESLKADGLVETLVWNQRTSTLVSGHQRLALLDEMEGHQDYELDVAAVDLDPVRERQLNVRLNSTSITGSYDMESLQRLVEETDGIDLGSLGFTQAELNLLSPKDSPGAELYSVPDELGDEMEKLASVRPGKPELSEEDIAEIKEAKKAGREQARKDDRTAYVTFVFGNADELTRFIKAAGLPEIAVQDGRDLAEKMGIDMDQLL